MVLKRSGLGVLVLLWACGGPEASVPLATGEIAFGVFGDGPYYPNEQERFEEVLSDVASSDVEWLIHIGDLLVPPCPDELFERRLSQLNAIPHPIVYTPGDNEWADCHDEGPLDRLASLRRIFFAQPEESLGGTRMALESQASDSSFSEFVENVRWTFGGLVFSTIHLVGSNNATAPFPGRTPLDDEEVERRTGAAVEWLDRTFDHARRVSAKGVVLAIHTNLWTVEGGPRPGYGDFLDRLAGHVGAFPGPVELIHGDTHTQRVDHPLVDGQGRAYPNFTRLETFGSPDIGWIRVVVDTVAGRITRHEPRLMR